MSFLNPFVLVALAAASIPFLLHLLNLRKLRRVEFSSLRFLKELQKTRIRSVKLKQILLLLLRAGLIIFAVLAFARPVLTGTSGLPGARGDATVVILIDDSPSMTIRDQKGERFARARDVARKIVEGLHPGDQGAIVSLSNPATGLLEGTSRAKEILMKQIDGMKPGNAPASYRKGINIALNLLQSAPNVNNEIYLITDNQRVNTSGLEGVPFVLDPTTRLRVVRIGRDSDIPDNLAIDSLQLASTLFEASAPLNVRVWVHNYGEHGYDDIRLSMYVENRRIAQTTISLKEGESRSVELSAPPDATGFIGGYVEVEGDRLEGDNRRYFALRIVDGARVAVLASNQSRRNLEVLFNLPGLFRPQFFAPTALSAVDLNSFSAVVLADAAAFGGGVGERLYDYVEAGGGVVVWGGPGLTADAFNSSIGAALRIAVSGPIDGTPASPLEFASVQKDHPLFSGVFNAASAGAIESPKIQRVLPPSVGDPIITLSNGRTFMSEIRRGRGRIIYIAVPPSMEWSDVPARSMFVPIAVRSTLYVGASGEEYQNFVVGDDAYLNFPIRGRIPQTLQVVQPDGSDLFVPVRAYETNASILIDSLNRPGIYKLVDEGREIARFAANIDPAESDIQPIADDRLKDVLTARMDDPDGFAFVDEETDITDAVITNRAGVEIWRYMLGLAILCAFAEMIVGRGGGTTDA